MLAGVHGFHYEFIFLSSVLDALAEIRQEEGGAQIKQVESGRQQSPLLACSLAGFALNLGHARL